MHQHRGILSLGKFAECRVGSFHPAGAVADGVEVTGGEQGEDWVDDYLFDGEHVRDIFPFTSYPCRLPFPRSSLHLTLVDPKATLHARTNLPQRNGHLDRPLR